MSDLLKGIRMKEKKDVNIEFKSETNFTPNYLYVWGHDTFYIKDVLKPLGFKWDSINRVWVLSGKREDIVKKVKELENYADLHWIGKPLTQSPLYITIDLKDKEYVVNTDKKTWDVITDYARDEGWEETKEIWAKIAFSMHVSPDRRYYILKDFATKKMYIMRDDEGTISNLMDAIVSFVYETVPRELGVTSNDKIRVSVVYFIIEYTGIKVRDNMTVTFKFNNFERKIYIEKASEHTAILDMKEISNLIADFVAENYKQI